MSLAYVYFQVLNRPIVVFLVAVWPKTAHGSKPDQHQEAFSTTWPQWAVIRLLVNHEKIPQMNTYLDKQHKDEIYSSICVSFSRQQIHLSDFPVSQLSYGHSPLNKTKKKMEANTI